MIPQQRVSLFLRRIWTSTNISSLHQVVILQRVYDSLWTHAKQRPTQQPPTQQPAQATPSLATPLTPTYVSLEEVIVGICCYCKAGMLTRRLGGGGS